jgi:peptidylprolyl isomerase
MAQTGDPTGTGTGGSDYPDLPAEFSQTATFERGTVGAARSNDPNSANSQFFIDFVPVPNLNGQYTIWGQVVDGMDAVDKIAPGEPPPNPDKIVKMQVAADADGTSKQAALAVLKAQQ